jgi:hypothetical protein
LHEELHLFEKLHHELLENEWLWLQEKLEEKQELHEKLFQKKQEI